MISPKYFLFLGIASVIFSSNASCSGQSSNPNKANTKAGITEKSTVPIQIAVDQNSSNGQSTNESKLDRASGSPVQVSTTQSLCLLDLYPNRVHIQTPKKDNVQITGFAINDDYRRVFYMHPPSLVYFQGIKVESGDKLRFSVGIKEDAWKEKGDGVKFSVMILPHIPGDKNKPVEKYSKYIDPRVNRNDCKWVDGQVLLSEFSGTVVDIMLQTEAGPNLNANCDWAGWSGLEITK